MEAQVRRVADKYLQNVRVTGEDNLRADCPLCDRQRTFVVSMSEGVWHCFKCLKGGTLIWLLKSLGLTHKQVERFRKEIGLAPPLPLGLKKRLEMKRRVVQEIPEYILAAYKSPVPSLEKVGFTPETLATYEVGYDKQNKRITFPIRDYLGRLIAISGRSENDSTFPRYKVYDSDPQKGGELEGIVQNYLPRNRDHLYGYNTVFPYRFYNPDTQGPIIVVEGFKGCLWLKQLGFAHTVALMGYSMTQKQRGLLGKLRGPYYIMLDHEPGKSFPDKFGRCAAVKISERLSKLGRTYLCLYPGFDDSNPYANKKEGTSPDDLDYSEVQAMITNAKTAAQLAARLTNNRWSRQ
jgi:DNA primase